MVTICCSDKENPLIESDAIPLGDVKLTWEDHEEDMEVVIEFNFSDTTIQVHTYKKSNPDVKKITNVNYKK